MKTYIVTQTLIYTTKILADSTDEAMSKARNPFRNTEWRCVGGDMEVKPPAEPR